MIWPMAAAKPRRAARLEHVRARVGVDVVMDFLGRLPDQEQAAGDQDQVAPREAVTEQREDRRRQLHDQRHRAEQRQPQDQRQPDADAAGPWRCAPATCWSGWR